MGEPDGRKRIYHGDLSINGGSVYVMDEFSEQKSEACGPVSAPSPAKPSATSMVIQCSAPGDVDTGYRRAIDAGCRSISAPADMFWNACYASVCDPYGHIWMFNAALPAK